MASSMSQPLLLVILLAVDAILLVDARPPDNKIIGGKPINIKDVPWQVVLKINRFNITHPCGGTIISDRWVMTAAHCTINATTVTVRAGSSNRTTGGTEYAVVDIVEHPAFDINITYHDISLLKTDRPIIFGEGVARATLPKARAPPPSPGSPVLVSGWGRTSNDKREWSELLMGVETVMVDFSTCEDVFSVVNPQECLQLCAGLKGSNCCHGDSGSPLVAENIVIGIVSTGEPWICAEAPALYTKVSTYIDWIERYIRS